MKKRIQQFGFVFPIEGGKHKGKYFYSYTDKDGSNKHSRVFSDVGKCSQEFALKFIEYTNRKVKEFIAEAI